MIKYLSIARKIHRFLVLTLTIFSLIIAFTGLFLKYPFISSRLNFLDLGMMRYIHNQLSPWLTVTLLLMALSGVLLYFSPWSRKS